MATTEFKSDKIFQATLRPDLLMRYYRGMVLPNTRTHIIVACFPKSGSTYLAHMLWALPDMMRATLVPGYERREPELAPDMMVFFQEVNYTAQLHLKYSAVNAALFHQFSVHPVVLVRNLFDVACSMLDHWDKESIVTPVAWVTEEVKDADAETRYAFFAEMMAPWYINFFVSWTHCTPPVTWVRYEDMIGNEAETLARIADDVDMPVSARDIEAAVTSVKSSDTRLNKGVAGRGQALPDDVKDRIRGLARFYPSVDFSPIGL